MAESFDQYQLRVAPPWARMSGSSSRWWSLWGTLKETFLEGTKAAVKQRYPRHASPTALEDIASDRRLERMPDEPEPAYVVRLESAFELWQWGGTNKGVLDAVLATRLCDPVHQGGLLVSPDIVEAWRWPDGTDRWARFWVVIAPGTHLWKPPHVWGSGHRWGERRTWGSTATREQVALLCRQVRVWKAGHAHCPAIIVVLSGKIWGWGGNKWGSGKWGGKSARWRP